MIDFISEHKDHSVPGPDGESGLRWGVEPLCQVLTEHGIKIGRRPTTSGSTAGRHGVRCVTPR